MSLVLRETHALIWWMDAGPITSSVVAKLQDAIEDGQLYFAPFPFWELGMLERNARYLFLPTVETWCRNVIGLTGASALLLSPDAAILSSRLPGDFHKDRADRLLVASAIDAGATFVTRDIRILDWAARTYALRILAR